MEAAFGQLLQKRPEPKRGLDSICDEVIARRSTQARQAPETSML